MEKEKKILEKTEEIMKILKPLTYRERNLILKFLGGLIDVDGWIENYPKEKSSIKEDI